MDWKLHAVFGKNIFFQSSLKSRQTNRQSTNDSTFWASLPISLQFIYHLIQKQLQEAKLRGHKWEKGKCYINFCV